MTTTSSTAPSGPSRCSIAWKVRSFSAPSRTNSLPACANTPFLRRQAHRRPAAADRLNNFRAYPHSLRYRLVVTPHILAVQCPGYTENRRLPKRGMQRGAQTDVFAQNSDGFRRVRAVHQQPERVGHALCRQCHAASALYMVIDGLLVEQAGLVWKYMVPAP